MTIKSEDVTTGSNMSGGQQTRIVRAFSKRLKAKFAQHDEAAGNRVEADIDAIIEEAMAPFSKRLAKPPKLFSDRVPTTLSDGSVITVLTPNKAANFAEWFSSILGVSPDTPSQKIGDLLVAGGHVVSPAQIEEMKQRTDRGENTGMRTDGWGNFYPIDSVSVARVSRNGADRPWLADVHWLSRDFRWRAGRRLLVCNLDPSKLGL
jgi:hypothetical protein